MTTRIGAILVEAKFITAAQLERARGEKVKRTRERRRGDNRLGAILVELKFITPKQLKWALQQQAKKRARQSKTDNAFEDASRMLEEMRTAALAVG